MRTRYIPMKASTQDNGRGEKYPDVLTYPADKFITKYPLKRKIVTYTDIYKFYMSCYSEYGSCQYDDIVLWLNGISTVNSLVIGEEYFLPSKVDIENFLVDNEQYKD